MKQQTRDMLMFGAGLVAIAVVALGIWCFSSYAEAQAFNNITGNHVTMWQAMWVELRVQ